MNLGTVRYHIFILSPNHRIVTYQADGKHVRYFINSGTYSKEEQMINVLVMRRGQHEEDPRHNTDQAGHIQRGTISEVGLPESAVSRYMKELAEKGIVVKELAPMGTSAYFLVNERRARVAKAMEIMKGTGNFFIHPYNIFPYLLRSRYFWQFTASPDRPLNKAYKGPTFKSMIKGKRRYRSAKNVFVIYLSLYLP